MKGRRTLSKSKTGGLILDESLTISSTKLQAVVYDIVKPSNIDGD
jgi:hypothetical protein